MLFPFRVETLYVYYLETPPTRAAIKQPDFLRYLPDKFERT